MTIIIDTPEGIAAARMIALRSGLSLECKTGMKLSRGRSANQIATDFLKGEGMIAQNKRPNKPTTYALLNKWMADRGFEDKPL